MALASAGTLLALLVAKASVVGGGEGRIYVSNEDAGDVAVIDLASEGVVARIPVGKRPRGLKVSRDGQRLYVALSGSPRAGPGSETVELPPADRSADGIGVVDLVAGKLLRVLPSGQDPETFDLSPDERRLFVSNEETAEVSVLDLVKGKIIARVKVGKEPEGVTVRPDGKVVYVTCEQDNQVYVIDSATLRVRARLDAGARPRAVAFTPDGRAALVTAELSSEVNLFDGRRHRPLLTVSLPASPGKAFPPRPMGVVLTTDGKWAFVSNGRGQSVAVIDVERRVLARMIEEVGTRPWGIALSPDGRKLYTANGPSHDVAVIDVASGKVERRVKVPGLPWGLAVAPAR